MSLENTLEPDAVLHRLLVEYLDQWDSGDRCSRDQFVMEHPALADDPALLQQFDQFLKDQQMFVQLSETIDLPSQDELDSIPAALDNFDDDAEKVFGDYELLEEVARGGMGVVYRARHSKLDRIVAIKMILSGALASREDVRRFQIEAQAAANLHHANIVAIYDVGQQDGHSYFSMQFVEGKNLAQLADGNPMDAEQAAEYLATVAEAVHYAHEKGTLHRDLKPSNILIDVNGTPQVTDFGLAKRAQADPQLTVSGAILGTPSFMSPEQATGNGVNVDRESDVYSLGATLYYLLTGQPPLVGNNPLDTMRLVVNSAPQRPRQRNSSVPIDLENICLKCLEKKPIDRYSTARELATDLRRFLRDEPVQANPISRISRGWRWIQKHPWRTITAIVVFAAMGWMIAGAVADANLKHLDERTIPYMIDVVDGRLRTRLGNKVSIIYHADVDVDLANQSFGEFTGEGGQQVVISMDGKKVTSKGMNGPLGVSRLTVNHHTVQLFDHGRKLMVDAPGGGGVTYLLSAYRELTIYVDEDGSHRVGRN